MTSVTENSAIAPHLLSPIGSQVPIADPVARPKEAPKPRDVTGTFHYYKDPEDGSPPAPNYVNKPGSYERVPVSQEMVVHDVRGTEDQYTLDTTGFQIYKHESAEKAFVDDEQIKNAYYPEVEELLKAA